MYQFSAAARLVLAINAIYLKYLVLVIIALRAHESSVSDQKNLFVRNVCISELELSPTRARFHIDVF